MPPRPAPVAPPRMPPSGRQIQLRTDNQVATVVEVGGGLRVYQVDGWDVIDGYVESDMVTAGRGQLLIPWPNRLHGGAYTWDGRTHHVPIDEPRHRNSLHGLCLFRSWVPQKKTATSVVMRLVLHPSPPYPFHLDLLVRYALDEEGLVVESTATNIGQAAAPYAQGAHPYVTVGVPVDEAILTLPAGSRLLKDQSHVPIGREAVENTAHDFRSPRRIGNLRLDDAFTDLIRSNDGSARTVLATGDNSRAVEVWADGSHPYLQVYTGDSVPESARRRTSLAVEPMTAPPNAFVTGEGVRRLRPGESTTHRWGIKAR